MKIRDFDIDLRIRKENAFMGDRIQKILNAKDTKKVAIYYHWDMDGYGSEFMIHEALDNYKKCDIQIYANMCKTSADEAKSFDKILETYDFIFIADLSINKYHAELIEEKYKDKVVLYDHHKPKYDISNYKWYEYHESSQDMPVSGTLIASAATSMYNKCILDGEGDDEYYLEPKILPYEDFAIKVAYWDTWAWKKYNYEEAYNLQQAFLYVNYMEGKDDCNYYFIDDFIEFVAKTNPIYSNTVIVDLVNKYTSHIEQSAKKWEQSCTITTMKNPILTNGELNKNGYEDYKICCGICKISEVSLVSDLLFKENRLSDNCLFVACDSESGKISLRSKYIDCREYAMKYDGGGHQGAAGFPMKRFNEFIANESVDGELHDAIMENK